MSRRAVPKANPAARSAQGTPMSSASAADSALRRGLRRPRTVIGLGIVAVCVLLGLLAPVLSAHSPLDQSFGALQSLSLTHPLGTDELGRDLLARVL